MTTPPKPTPIQPEDDSAKWLALLLRQGLKLIVSGIEKRYGLCDDKERRAA
jgi:hypothetical protein